MRILAGCGLPQTYNSNDPVTFFLRDWQDVYEVSVPEQQLVVTEQLVRQLAAASGQLAVAITMAIPGGLDAPPAAAAAAAPAVSGAGKKAAGKGGGVVLE